MSRRKSGDLPEDIPSIRHKIWDDMGIEFDDQAREDADFDDKERLLRIYEEEDEREKKFLEEMKNRDKVNKEPKP